MVGAVGSNVHKAPLQYQGPSSAASKVHKGDPKTKCALHKKGRVHRK